MSTIKHPVGPQSSKVYWRRRLIVGVGLLFVLVIIFLIIVRPGAGPDEQGTAPKSAASAATTDAPAAAASDPAAGASACNPARVQVEAITDAVSYEPGQQPALSLSLTNTGTEPCVINVGTSKQVFTISSGADVYWTSTDCLTDPADAEVTLKPGQPVSSSAAIEWERVRSSPDTCDEATRDAAPAGGAAYNLSVSVDGIESATPKQFFLS
ncbi:hypothetical protein E3T26_12085 [Cryobacterium sp. TMT1-21]|uniref:DUF4232 domain-containing protein n=1 Tax=Cryobacterium shii TaxID=1259235 RepID=A0AAQ2C6B1_9MICO|nr:MULTISPECIES: hypothetical protein [Cryobacterium]TFC47251.1 hypothetical protein E3O49_08460 [Cryobacterium shii]TFC86903.1 hypothetical protein E3T24_05850 [Cryobacterium sp. TmT2-59]TFD12017.1 hypothetical protein E3T26_12085 [Cryobacterium sp. TMT1-21]TFD14638.1 hypothetical protein E3T42_11545 [Cryobacterium sp. TMT4-10]TFD37982.1 hypothetical protein E3T37_11030 [Cryobacterium sp. TMT2-10]